MNKIIRFLFLLLPVTVFLSCNEEDELPKPTTFIASDGTYIGVIHLAYESIPGAEAYEVVRLNNETAEWQEIGGWTDRTNWDDYGFLLNNGELIPGQEYQYKLRSHANSPGFSPYSEIITGYSYDPDPVEIMSITRDNETQRNIITWNDPNDYSNLQNLLDVEYIVYYAHSDDLDNFYEAGRTTNLYYDDYIYSNELDKVFVYKIATRYNCTVTDSHGSSYSKYYEIEGDMEQEGSGGDDPNIINYNKTDLGTILTSGNAVTFTETKQNGSNLYLGVLKNVDVTGYGKPGVYVFNGSSWSETGGSMPTDIINSTSIDEIAIAASSSNIYLATLDLDSIYVHKSDGSTWSENLAVKNLGYDDCPTGMDIEVFVDELYLATKVYPDWDLKVFKWTGTDWETIGGDVNGFITSSVDVFEVTLNNFEGTLYLSYLVKNSDYNSTLYIKHLNGTDWDTDLEWTADYIMDINVTKRGSDIYFSSSTQALAEFKGGVFKVSSSTSVNELISENDNWFYTPYGITVDSDGNVIVCSHKLESQTLNYPSLNLFDGSSWNTISGNFSDGMRPVSVHADGTTIYYVYGDKSNTTTFGDTKALKSFKLTK